MFFCEEKKVSCLSGSITFDATLTQLHADKHQQAAKMENTGQVRTFLLMQNLNECPPIISYPDTSGDSL